MQNVDLANYFNRLTRYRPAGHWVRRRPFDIRQGGRLCSDNNGFGENPRQQSPISELTEKNHPGFLEFI